MDPVGHQTRISHQIHASATNDASWTRPYNVIRPLNGPTKARSQASYRVGSRQMPRLLQPTIRCTETRRRIASNVQFAQTKQLFDSTTLQDGNNDSSSPSGSTRRLHDIVGSVRRVPARANSSTVAQVSTFPLASKDLPVQDSTIRLVTSPMALYPANQANITMGSSARNTRLSIPGRLDSHSLLLSASDETHCTIENTTHGPRLAHQPEEVGDGANTDHTTPRLHYRFNTDETQDTGSEASRFEEVHSIDCRSPSSITENNSQSHHAHTRHRPGSLSDVSLHAETDAVQESARSISEAMGFETTSTTRLSGRVALVASQHHQLERTVLGTTTADIHALCRRQRRRMGSSPRPDDDTTTLVTRVKDALNQLARITSGIPSHPRLPTAPQHVDSDPDRQYLCNDLHQQAGRHSIASAQRPRRSSVASLSSEPCSSDGTTYTRDPEFGSGSGITLFPDTTIMAADSPGLSADPTPFWPSRRGPVRGFFDASTTQVRNVALRRASDGDRCLHDTVVQLHESVSTPIMSAHSQVPCQDFPGPSPTGDPSDATLAIGHLVPAASSDDSSPSITDEPTRLHSHAHSRMPLTMGSQELEARRMAVIRRRFASSGYGESALSALLEPLIDSADHGQPTRQLSACFLIFVSDMTLMRSILLPPTL